MIGTCKLCHQERELIKAHIIPRSFFHAIKGNSKQLLAALTREKKPVEYFQNGIWDPSILCAECECRFCSWDTYGFDVLGNPPGNNTSPMSDADVAPFVLKGINYRELKLFVLSVLWRASVTKHAFFDGVDLGEHEPKIAEMIRSSDPKSAEVYSVIIGRMVEQKYDKTIFPPWQVEIGNNSFCVLYLPCLKIHVKLDRNPLPEPLRIAVLQDRDENIALPMHLQRAEKLFLDKARQTFKRWQPRRPPK